MRFLPQEMRHPCRVCAIWKCSDCGWKRRPANKLNPDAQFCVRCESKRGVFQDILHTASYMQRNHDEDADRILGPVS